MTRLNAHSLRSVLHKLRLSSLHRNRRFIPLLLVLAGIALLLYVGTQYGQMYFEQRRLAERFEQEQQTSADPTNPAKSTVAHADDSTVRLVIPKIDLTSFIVEGTTHRALLLGPGHMAHTARPGDLGNAVISGHRDTFFRHIHELEKGDQIYVDRGGKRYVYEVTSKRIVDPDDLSVTRPTSDSELTLITCYPTYYIGPAPQRLIVSAKLTPGEQQAQESKDTTKTTKVLATSAD